jgi:ATP-binding cassette subfamily B protein
MVSGKVKKGSTVKSVKKLFGSSKKYQGYFIFSSILLVASVVFSIISPSYLKELTDEISNNAVSKTIDMDLIMRLALLLISFYAISAIASYFANFLITTATQKYSRDLREEITAKINRIPLKYFDSHANGDTLSILTNDIDQIANSLQQSIGMLVQSVFMLAGVLIAMFVTSWQMALTALITLPLMALFLLLILKLAMPQFIKRQNLIGKVNGVVEENFSGQSVIKCFNASDRVDEEFEKENHELQQTMMKAQFFGGLMQPIMSFISYIAYAAVCIAGGLLMNTSGSGVTMGTITAFVVYVNLFQSPLSQIAQGLNTMQTAAAASERVFGFLAEDELSKDSTNDYFFRKDGKENVTGQVSFDHVYFGYDPSREIIHNFSADIKPGMKVAIVGPTGAGKTTMVNLLMRFYEVNSGTIKIDDISTKDMNRKEIHDVFGMVLQDTWLFEGTVRENIVYNTPNVSEADIEEVCKEANISHFIHTLPGGLDYMITDDASISGGQKQLITIARAMLRKTPLMILDEATSNVDTRTEELIQEAMDKLTKGRTSFVIAHRLSTIKNADMILVMNDGNIIEQGNHDQLMAQNGFYASLYNSQFAFE